MGAIELIHGLYVALLWLLGSAAALFVALSVPPVDLRARVDSLHFDEETSLDWDAVPFELQLGALFGALHVRFERREGNQRVDWRLFGITKPIATDGERGGRRRRGGHGVRDRREESRAASGEGGWRFSWSRSRPKAGGRTKRRRKRAIGLDEMKRLLPEARWLLAQAKRRMRLEVRGALVYGFPDPFATAMAHLLTTTLPTLPELRLQPDYAQGTLRGEIEFSLRAYPWQALLVLAIACFRPGVRSLWWPPVRNALRFRPRRTKEVMES